MTQSPLAVKRRREAGKPPIVINQNKDKDKKKTPSVSTGTKIVEYIYFLVGFIWYSLLSLWKKPTEDQLEARIIPSKALFTPSEFVVKITRSEQSFGSNPPQKLTNQDKTFRGELRNVDQQEAWETLEAVIRSKGKEGTRGYFLATRIGYDKIAVDPEHMIPNQHW